MPPVGTRSLIRTALEPFYQTTDGDTLKLYQGNAVQVLRKLPPRSVHCCVTSPPYWGLRNYQVEGQLGDEPSPDCDTHGLAQCGQCYVCSMVAVFTAVKSVLRDDGVLYLNLGDTYDSPTLASGNLTGIPWRVALALQANGWVLRQDVIWAKPSPMPESVNNRCTKAHEYLFLFSKGTGYYYDAEAVKEKQVSTYKSIDFVPNSKKDRENISGVETAATGASRANRSHDLINGLSNKRSVWSVDDHQALLQWLAENDPDALNRFLEESKNKKDLWWVSSQGYPGAHFATFPGKLIEPCIKAGTSAKGCCGQCGTPWVRVVSKSRDATRPDNSSKYGTPDADIRGGSETLRKRMLVTADTTGWRPGCTCNGKMVKKRYSVSRANAIGMPGNSAATKKGGSIAGASEHFDRSKLTEEVEQTSIEYVSKLPLEDHSVVPCTVLDPFMGSGTTAIVALELGLRCVGIDLSQDYLRDHCVPRIEGLLLSVPATAGLVKRKEAKPAQTGRKLPVRK